MEAHSAGVGAVREQSIIQTKIVLLIALPAFARKIIIKVIIVDLQEMSPGHLLGLAAIALVLGVIYWLMPDGDDRLMLLSKGEGMTHENIA